jgi:ribosomal protein L23
MIFVVDKKATKAQIKRALVSILKLKIVNVNTMIGPNGIKKAYVKLSPETPALDVATQLGLM